jgi:hypothetical protein
MAKRYAILWYRIVSPRAERMAAADTFDAQPPPFEETVFLNSLAGVMRTGGNETATGGQQRREEPLIQFDNAQDSRLYQMNLTF